MISHTIVGIPFIAFIALLFTAISYYMVGLSDGADHFGKFVAYLFLALYVMETLVALISAIFPIFVAALAICAFLNGFFMCVQGSFMSFDELPEMWHWGHYWSYQKYVPSSVFDVSASFSSSPPVSPLPPSPSMCTARQMCVMRVGL